LKALVVGFGAIGKRHGNNLLKIPNMEVIICTNQKDNINLKRKFKIVNTIKRGIEEKPDFAIIANVTSEHINTAIKLAKVGIDLFIEKPLSNSLDHCKYLDGIVKKKKIVTMIGCNFRFDKSIQTIQKIVKQKKLGKIISTHVENGSYLPDWHPYEDYRKGYSARKKLGGGVVLTNIHEIDYLYWIFGKVNKVFSVTGKFSDLEVDVEDLSEIIMKFKDKSIASIHLDHYQRPTFRQCKIIGTKGTIIWDFQKGKLDIFNLRKQKWENIIHEKHMDRNLTYQKEIAHFIQCVKSRKKTINPLSEGIETLKIVLLIMKSSKINRMISV
jgi:predicted dehydrogenase